MKSRDAGAVRPYVLLNECPEVVGSMALVIGGGGSLEGAIRKVASDGPSESKALFSDIVSNADTRTEPDMRSALGRKLSELPQATSSYAMSVRMVMSAASARDESERDRLLEEARSISLAGLRDAGKMYSSSLNMPCMIVFGVGIMVPMVLMSVLPMLKVSGSFGVASFDPLVVSVITLVLIPAFVCAVMLMMRERNPFRRRGIKVDPKHLVPLLSALPVSAVLCCLNIDLVSSICIGCASAGVLDLLLLHRGSAEEKERLRKQDLLKESVFDTGNYLLTGMPFEDAFRRSVSSRPGCSVVSRTLGVEMSLCRGDCAGAVVNTVSPISVDLAEVYRDVYAASRKDVRGSGKLAHALGRQITDQDAVRRAIRTEMKSITDTMTGTAMVFAPLVLGLCVTILGPLSRITSGLDISGTSLTLSVYLVELCTLISVMLTLLDGSESSLPAFRRLSMMLPVSMIVFLVTSSLSI